MKSWNVRGFFHRFNAHTNEKFSVIAVNSTLGNKFSHFWEKAVHRVAADGAANRLMNYFGTEAHFPPHVIVGDFDSLNATARQFYENQKTNFIRVEDQDSTDLHKAIDLFLPNSEYSAFKEPIYVFGGLGGNLSQAFGNVHCLYHYKKTLPNQIFLISPDNVGCLLEAGTHKILGEKGDFCSFIPLGSSAEVTSKQLKYPMDKLKLSFDTIVSTSNSFVEDEITVETNEPIFFLLDASKH